jgi:hypothetical protein
MLSLQEFGVFFDKAGLPLTPEQKATLYQGWPLLEKMMARVSEPPQPRENEPSVVFQPEVK